MTKKIIHSKVTLISHTVGACEVGSFMTSKGFVVFDGCGKAFVAWKKVSMSKMKASLAWCDHKIAESSINTLGQHGYHWHVVLHRESIALLWTSMPAWKSSRNWRIVYSKQILHRNVHSQTTGFFKCTHLLKRELLNLDKCSYFRLYKSSKYMMSTRFNNMIKP